jgi:hypothetical protein
MRIYRGQKEWSPEMRITAPSLRYAFGHDAGTLTEQLLLMISGLISNVNRGDKIARAALEDRLLFMQNSRYENPYVSCSHRWAIAQSFALARDTPGYILAIDGDGEGGLDYEAVRQGHSFFGDAVDYLAEFGIPREIAGGFTITEVQYVQPRTEIAKVVYPCG